MWSCNYYKCCELLCWISLRIILLLTLWGAIFIKYTKECFIRYPANTLKLGFGFFWLPGGFHQQIISFICYRLWSWFKKTWLFLIFFNPFFSVWISVETLLLVFDILLQIFTKAPVMFIVFSDVQDPRAVVVLTPVKLLVFDLLSSSAKYALLDVYCNHVH